MTEPTVCRHCGEEVTYEEMSGTWQHGGVDPYRNDLSVCPGTTQPHEPETDECPAGGPHEWEEHDSGDAYVQVIRWWACANCGTPAPDQDKEL